MAPRGTRSAHTDMGNQDPKTWGGGGKVLGEGRGEANERNNINIPKSDQDSISVDVLKQSPQHGAKRHQMCKTYSQDH